MKQSFVIPLYKQFVIGKKTYDIPTQDAIEGILASLAKFSNSKKAQAAYWLHRQAKVFIASLVKQETSHLVPMKHYPVKISYEIVTTNTKRWDIANLMTIYRKVIPDVLTGKFELGAGALPVIIIDDDWKHLRCDGEATVTISEVYNYIKVKLEPFAGVEVEYTTVSKSLF